MISIVMPVYNTGEYLRASIASILEQSYGDFELICVDDASTDPLTLELLDHFGSIDKRISVIHQMENGGAGEARNTGLEIASGDWIIFLDADDMFDCDMLEVLYRTAEENDADMCVCSHRTMSAQTGQILHVQMPKEIPGITDRVFSLAECGEDGLTYWFHVPWNKLIRMELLKQNSVRFLKLRIFEDGYFCVMCTVFAKRIVYACERKPLLSYRVHNENQLTATTDALCDQFYFFIKEVFAQRWEKASMSEKCQLVFLCVDNTILLVYGERPDSEKVRLWQNIKRFLKYIQARQYAEFLSQRTMARLLWLLTYDYHPEWMGNYYIQLVLNKADILNVIRHENEPIVIWGNGKRGQALQRLLHEEGIQHVMVVDRNAAHQSNQNPWGYGVMQSCQLSGGEIVFATNHQIYNDIESICHECKAVMVDLENYCFL